MLFTWQYDCGLTHLLHGSIILIDVMVAGDMTVTHEYIDDSMVTEFIHSSEEPSHMQTIIVSLQEQVTQSGVISNTFNSKTTKEIFVEMKQLKHSSSSPVKFGNIIE